MSVHEFDRTALVDGLSRQLADMCALRLKTEGYHWNLSEAILGKLHQILQPQYIILGAAANEIAECIHNLGAQVPCSYQQYTDLMQLSEETGVPSAEHAIFQLETDHETMAQNAINLMLNAKAADHSAPFVDLLRRHIQMHQQAALALLTLHDGDNVVFLD